MRGKYMKKKILLSLFCLLILPSSSTVSYNVHYLKTSTVNYENNDCFIINSFEEFNEYYLANIKYYSNSLDKLMSRYNNDFFNNNSLVVIKKIATSGSYEYRLKYFKINEEKVIVKINQSSSKYVSYDLAMWNFIIETNKINSFLEVIIYP